MAENLDLFSRFDKGLGLLAGLFAVAGGLGILVLLGVTVVAVFWRYALSAPIFGIEDVSIITLTVVAAGAVCFGGRKGAHVSIDLIDRFASTRVTRVTDTVMYLLASAICLLAVYALVSRACGIEKACITSNLAIEHRPFFWILAAAFMVYALQLAVQFLRSLTGRACRETQD